mgnify:CR=1 FL=1
MKPSYISRKTCRICGSNRLFPILNLGKTPHANSFFKRGESHKEYFFPLNLVFCRTCSLVQLKEVVDPSVLFRRYSYLTGASAPMVEHFKTYAQDVIRRRPVTPKDLVVELGSNDGSLLLQLKGRARILGVDPAKNVAVLARKKGVPTIDDFFNSKLAKKIVSKHGKAKIIIANNVFAHIDNIHEVLEGIKILLADDGLYVFETHWVGNLIGEGGFDQIYHEHLSFFSLHALSYLLSLHGLKIVDVQSVPMHGESMRVFAKLGGIPGKSVKKFLSREKRLKLNTTVAYKNFSKKVSKNKKDLLYLLNKLKKEGKHIAGYGAPAKSTTLLHYLGVDPKVFDYITDTTPLKQGRLTPGTHIPIVSPDRLLTERPYFLLLFSWNYTSVILKKEQDLRHKGTKFIIPVPEVKIL